jgi:hypothetical protein
MSFKYFIYKHYDKFDPVLKFETSNNYLYCFSKSFDLLQLLDNAFSFSSKYSVVKKKIPKELIQPWQFLIRPNGPRGAEVLKFTNLVPLV